MLPPSLPWIASGSSVHVSDSSQLKIAVLFLVAHNEAPLLILEYCPHGNLKEFLRTRRAIYEPEWKDVDNVRLSITDIAKFALHVAKGMEFLISRKVGCV
jgi:serine/threonine protein kinase